MKKLSRAEMRRRDEERKKQRKEVRLGLVKKTKIKKR